MMCAKALWSGSVEIDWPAVGPLSSVWRGRCSLGSFPFVLFKQVDFQMNILIKGNICAKGHL